MKINKKGFTLVEIAVVIAIMAVLLAVLAPSLLRSVEDSRMQRDDSAMAEVTHAVKLALSDPIVLDEMVQYSCTNNYVTYTDSSGVYGAKYTDEEFWAPDGAGFATTITFNPEINAQGDTIYRLDTALVNDKLERSATATISDAFILRSTLFFADAVTLITPPERTSYTLSKSCMASSC